MAELQKGFKASSRSSVSLLLLVLLLCLNLPARTSMAAPRTVRVGVILDLKSALGSMVNNSLAVAVEDYYSEHPDTATKIDLMVRNVPHNDVVGAASAGYDLITKEMVDAILGPENSEEARYVVELGREYYVPVIWFSPSGPSLLPPRSRFFISSNTARSHCFQFKAIAAIIEACNWQCVIPIYEEPEFGNDLIPCLTYALQEMDTRVPYTSAIRQDSSYDDIAKELDKMKGYRTCAFLAHMTVELWSTLVEPAKKAGLMNKGNAWILTQGLSSVLDPEALNINEKGYMDGALGVRPLWVVYNRTKLLSIEERLYDKSLSLYGLWAYDTVTALANAAENAGFVTALAHATENTGLAHLNLRNETGPELLKAIRATDLRGLSGNFSLRKGQIEPSQVVIYIVNGPSENDIGYWTTERGLFLNYREDGQPDGKYKLWDPIWQGITTERTPKLRIGVPKTHFTPFVDVDEKGHCTGLAVDVFKRVVEVLPFPLPHDFVPLTNSNGELTPSGYDDLLCDITSKGVDIIIGDITVVENRTNCVDFTMPYLDSRVSIVVKVRSDSDSKNGWVLLEPFRRSTGLTVGVSLAGVAVIVFVCIFEMRAEGGSNLRDFVRNPFLVYVSGVEFFKSRTSKWVVIVAMFVLGIAMQVYTAYLTSILSEMTMVKPSPWRDLQEIKRNNGSVGYQKDSWVKDLLIHQMRFKDHQLKALGSREEYKKALSNGTVDAIFDETPYLMLLLSMCPSCKMAGPIYKAGGFAFAFPKNSTLVSHFSNAILNVTQNVTMFRKMKKEISLPDTIDKSEYRSDVEARSLTVDDFGSLFKLVFSVIALFLTILILKISPITGCVRLITRWMTPPASGSAIELGSNSNG